MPWSSWVRIAGTSHRPAAKPKRLRPRLAVEELETREVPSASNLALDFGTVKSPAQPGFRRVATPAFTPKSGYGFAAAGSLKMVDRGPAAIPLSRDFVMGTNHLFKANLNKGWYEVTVYFGDARVPRPSVFVIAEGAAAATVPATAAGEFTSQTFAVQLRDKQLGLRFVGLGGAGWKFALNGLRIRPLVSSVNAGPDRTISEGQTIQFAGQASGVAPFTYSWSFGDGTSAGGTLNPSKTYNDQGTYWATLTVTDGAGVSRADFAKVTVGNVAPSVTLAGQFNGTAGTAINFSATVTDPSPTDTAAGFTYLWNFGDNSTSSQPNPSHTYGSPGTYPVTLTVHDKDGGQTVRNSQAVVSSSGGSTFPNNGDAPDLPPPSGTVINVSTMSALRNAVSNLQSNQTIMIAAGTYNLTDILYLPQGISNFAIRGATGNAGDVIIQGDGMNGDIRFGFWADNVDDFTFGDFTIRNIKEHPFILNGGADSPLFHNLRIVDAGDQFIKANPSGNDGVDNGIVEYCTLEYTTVAPDTYTNGVDVHTGRDWIIRYNVFKNFRTISGLCGPAVLMWNKSQGTITEYNTFIDNHRDIAYGLISAAYNDHAGGIIRNNFITHTPGLGGDVPIGVFGSPNTKVLHNTVLLNGNYGSAVEYRFSNTTGVVIRNNLTDAAISARDGAAATVSNNLTSAQASWFVNAAIGDLHLKSTTTQAIDKVAALADVLLDYDGQNRPGSGTTADYGADEYVA
ncbi:MAG: PKD domain-containing protein [Gemmataceae bacterium]|nr:PKD domain-containing protein [Gemmataceae bacterium]